MANAARKVATYQDVLNAPPDKVVELIHGVLHVLPRPAALHTRAASELGAELLFPFGRGRGGPGGWLILDEPELHLDEHVLVPDLAGWRRERMPELPDTAFFSLRPDWVCEVLSPSTAKLDRSEKMPLYAKHGVQQLWLIDPIVKTLEVFRLDGQTWRLLKVQRDDDRVRAEPFEVHEFELNLLWQR